MSKFKADKIYTNLGEVISDFYYRDFIYFMYNLGVDYYDGLNVVSKEEWQEILRALKDNYTKYEVERKIRYTEFRTNMAEFLNRMFYKHRSVHEVMTDALTSFGKGNRNARLKFLIKDFDEREAFENEIDG